MLISMGRCIRMMNRAMGSRSGKIPKEAGGLGYKPSGSLGIPGEFHFE